MEAYIVEWLNLFGRWIHLVTGIAWIGASFYFVWLDDSLEAPKAAADVERGVGGEVWSVHGGGFYHAQKYRVAPPRLPETLHWFKWEAYWTWMSGMFLLALVYWYSAEAYLIDPGVADIGKAGAIAISIGTVVGGWVVYDLLCRSALGRSDAALGLVVFALTIVAAWGLTQVFSGRGAYIHYGAMLGTIMVANVFFVIIPGQRELVAAKREGREPDVRHGLNGKQRSVHNTYFTLPVLLVMISNHYASTYGHRHAWLILVALSAAGALVRVWFVARHKGRPSPVPLVAAAVLFAAVVGALAPAGSATRSQGAAPPAFAEVRAVVERRCAGCHASRPTQAGFAAPPKGVVFDTPGQVLAQAAAIHQQSVATQVMPIGNLTGMTGEERALLGRWFEAGAGGE
jgi:uncharacterized membrane protein